MRLTWESKELYEILARNSLGRRSEVTVLSVFRRYTKVVSKIMHNLKLNKKVFILYEI